MAIRSFVHKIGDSSDARLITTALICLWIGSTVARSATPQDDIAAQVPIARRILDTWQADQPEKAQRKLHVVLWTPADREPAPQYRERLSAILHDIQDFYASEMRRIGFGVRTLHFDEGADRMIRVLLVRSRRPYSHYSMESGSEIRTECLATLRAAGIDADKETIVIFCNMANWDPTKKTMTQNSPYYAGGSHMSGSAWQVDSPLLNLDYLTKKEPTFHDGQYGNISVGRYNSIFIGGAAHELGHSLGLPHSLERPEELAAFGISLMGAGNRTYGEDRRGEGKGSFLTLADAFRLASHPIFCGSIKGVNLPPNTLATDLSIQQVGKGFDFSGTVTADPPVYGVIGYMDPEGGQDYDATTISTVPDKDGKFVLHCQAFAPGKAAVLRVVYLQANGVASGFVESTPYRYPYFVDGNGKADISTSRNKLLLEPLVNAVAVRDVAAAETLRMNLESLNDPFLTELATRHANTMNPRLKSSIEPEIRTVLLSDMVAVEESTGYGPAIRDRLPEQGGILSSGGQLFSSGFYAHAPARHVWNLDGTWKSLQGKAGIAHGHEGSVRFVIEGDGRTLWQSSVVKSGKLTNFTIDLTGIKRLTLRTEDGGDGATGDWGLWLAPVLSR